jgi:V-type H+-transporting ATPase subunit a
LSILRKMLNTVHFKSYLDFFFEWIPQQIFFFTTFGYMCVLIIKKWTIEWDVEMDSAAAPSIIGQMIALPLAMGSTEDKPLWDQ